MARRFFVAPVPFFGNFTPKPISLCRESQEDPNAVTLEIPWFAGAGTPYADGAVQVDLTVQGASNPIKKIRSMVIDNTGVDVAVFIQFPDTRDVITVLANSVLRVAVLTNSLQFVVYTEIPFTVITDPGPLTRIIVTNVYLDPIVNRENDTSIGQYLNSQQTSSLGVSYSPIGMSDIQTHRSRSLTVAGNDNLDLSQGGSLDLLFRGIRIWIVGAYNTDIVKLVRITIEENAFAVITATVPVKTDLSSYGRQLIYEKTDTNWFVSKDIALTLKNDVACSAGSIEVDFDYTAVSFVPGFQ